MPLNNIANPLEREDTRALVDEYRKNKRLFELFANSVQSEFASSPALNTGIPPVIHSMKFRLKDEDHLADKINRKRVEGRVIDENNIFTEISDLAGLRILHLYQSQFSQIHDFISDKVKRKSWKLLEKPLAYTWDPESIEYFKSHKIRTALKPSYYTSVHYIIAPASNDAKVCCEVQIRTLFEEIWGEIDHSINYPHRTDKLANIEQLRVLSKLVSTGTRLADAIFKVHNKENGLP